MGHGVSQANALNSRAIIDTGAKFSTTILHTSAAELGDCETLCQRLDTRRPSPHRCCIATMGRLDDKVAIVTGICLRNSFTVWERADTKLVGAAGGFGEGIAKHFAEEGARVLICDINAEAGEKVAASSEAFAFQTMDVSKAADWQTAIDKTVKLWGKVDILVNNAGTSYSNKVREWPCGISGAIIRGLDSPWLQSTNDVTEAEFDKVMAVNVKSVFLGSNAFTAQAKEQGTGGAIVNIASVGAHRPRPGLVWYNASKAAIANVSRQRPPLLSGWIG